MRGNTVYLDAPERTQDLLNAKWSLRSAGYSIGSTWHEGETFTSLLAFRDHWNARSVGQLQICDSLVVICGNGDRSMPELAMMAGFALARGMRVFWVGSPIEGLCDFLAVQQFKTVADFEKHIVQETYSQTIATDAQLAA
jgi:hypothetical protein